VRDVEEPGWPAGGALLERRLLGRALLGRALLGRALLGRALSERAMCHRWHTVIVPRFAIDGKPPAGEPATDTV
jgi:hypothetical protein